MLLLHDVDARRHLRDGVLDLQPGVHLDEVECAVLDEKLEGADAAVADLPAGFGAALADLGDQMRRRMPGAGASSSTF